jgi:hypothetical protein
MCPRVPEATPLFALLAAISAVILPVPAFTDSQRVDELGTQTKTTALDDRGARVFRPSIITIGFSEYPKCTYLTESVEDAFNTGVWWAVIVQLAEKGCWLELWPPSCPS